MDSFDKHEVRVQQFNDCLEWLDDNYSQEYWWASDRQRFVSQTQPIVGIECPEREEAMIALYALMTATDDSKDRYGDFMIVRNALLKLEC